VQPTFLIWSEPDTSPEANLTERLIVALDVKSSAAAMQLVDQLGDAISFYKIGSPLFTHTGPEIVKELKQQGKKIFLDLKFHDIPNTVAQAVTAAAALEVDMLTVHAGGGAAMMMAARKAVEDDAGPRILAVTVLTSFSVDDAEQVWGKQLNSLREEVTRMAQLAADAGTHGVVASPLEAEALKRRHGADFLVVTPGIRPAGAARGDQARTATPADAVRAGADYLIVGRPVIDAADPRAVVDQMQEEMSQVLTP
jgi:orotidine-5'-phosphate decarboxylase